MKEAFVEIPAPPDMRIRAFDDADALRVCGAAATEAARIARSTWKRPNYWKKRKPKAAFTSLPRPVGDDMSVASVVRAVAGKQSDRAVYRTELSTMVGYNGASLIRVELDRAFAGECGNVDRGGGKFLDDEKYAELIHGICNVEMIEASLDDLIRAVRRASVFGEVVTIKVDPPGYVCLASTCPNYGEALVRFPCKASGWDELLGFSSSRLIEGLEAVRKIGGESEVVRMGYFQFGEKVRVLGVMLRKYGMRVYFALANHKI